MYFGPFPPEYNNSTKDEPIVLAEDEAHILKTALIQKSSQVVDVLTKEKNKLWIVLALVVFTL